MALNPAAVGLALTLAAKPTASPQGLGPTDLPNRGWAGTPLCVGWRRPIALLYRRCLTKEPVPLSHTRGIWKGWARVSDDRQWRCPAEALQNSAAGSNYLQVFDVHMALGLALECDRAPS